MYGTINSSINNAPISAAAVQWQVSGGGSATASATFATVVGGPTYYVTRLPFETRTVGGSTYTPTPNTLELKTNDTTYNRSVTVNNQPGTLVAPALGNFTFSAADRGRVERVDIRAAVVDGTTDTDGDGVPDWMELLAGTDPNNANSVLKLDASITPGTSGGLTITWQSVAGKAYRVERTTDLGETFGVLPGGNSIPSGGAATTYTDATATGPGPFFYRISLVTQ